jgi:hypothetical protein
MENRAEESGSAALGHAVDADCARRTPFASISRQQGIGKDYRRSCNCYSPPHDDDEAVALIASGAALPSVRRTYPTYHFEELAQGSQGRRDPPATQRPPTTHQRIMRPRPDLSGRR